MTGETRARPLEAEQTRVCDRPAGQCFRHASSESIVSVPISGRTTPRSEPWMPCSLPISGVSSDRNFVVSSPTGTRQRTVAWSSS